MDPDPEIFPVLAFVLSQVDPNTYPFLPPNLYQDLISDMPHLANPVVVSSLVQSIPSNIDQTRTFLSALGPPPEPSSVSAARAKLEHDPGDEAELGIYRAVVKLDEIYDQYGKQLRDAEQTLAAVYGSVVEELDHEEQVDEEVVRILKAAETEVVERVDLSWRQLRLIPEALGKLNGLVVLNLSHNQLKVIPDSVGGLKKLGELNVSSNLLKTLPDSVGLLINLKTLNVSGNKLDSLPESISGCSGLKELDSSYNNLTFLPPNIGFGLTNLEKLNISLNKIRILPPSICEIKSLRLLDARFNEIHGLPHEIGKLTYLETMNLSNNFSDMTTLPDSIGDLMNLRDLDLSNNQIQALPDSFRRLENLTNLNLEQNPLVIPPPEVATKGARAVREFLTKRWHDLIEEENERSRVEALKEQQAQSGWFGWGSSKARGLVSDVSRGVGGYLYSGTEARDPYLEEER